jgi:hypothetical protein
MDEINYISLLRIFKNHKNCNKGKIESGIHDYSLMNSLLKINREVQLHSNFIFSMINPNGLHYCDNEFLKLFLKIINLAEERYIDLKSVTVHKERGGIDLLITDNKKFIIIENKLNAKDQDYQITRYIEYIVKEYNLVSDISPTPDLSEIITIVYLSKNRAQPSKDSNSIIGFKINSIAKNELILEWENNPVNLCSIKTREELDLKLKDNTKFTYRHMDYYNHINKWITDSRIWLTGNRPVNSTLQYAFNEYELIISKLDKSKSWRQIMTLDSYVLGLSDTVNDHPYGSIPCSP